MSAGKASPRGGESSIYRAKTAGVLARRLGAGFRKQVERQSKEFLRTGSVESLHDLRVGARRLRMVLRLFRAALKQPVARQAENAVGRLCEGLGPARDADVWLAFLEEVRGGEARRRGASWDRVFRLAAARAARNRAGVRALLRSAEFRRTCRMAERAFSPGRGGSGRAGRRSARRESGRLLLRAFERIPDIDIPGPKLSAAELHEVRRRCRRARYAAEFLWPLAGKSCREMENRLHALTDALGTHHDMDVHLGILARSRRKPPRSLVAEMEKRRRSAADGFARAWRRLRRPGFAARVKRECRTAMK